MTEQEVVATDRSRANVIGGESRMKYVVREIRRYIVDHRLEPGDRLPTERNMADLFYVSRTVVRDAVKTLSGLGIVDVRDRVGVFISETGSASLGEELTSHFHVDLEAIHSLVEVRKTLETSCAEWAAERCTHQDRVHLRALIKKNEDCVTAGIVGTSFRQIDDELHIEIARVARNQIVFGLLRGVKKHLSIFDVFLEPKTEFAKSCTIHHSRIVEAICNNSPGAARAAMADHLDLVYQHLLDVRAE